MVEKVLSSKKSQPIKVPKNTFGFTNFLKTGFTLEQIDLAWNLEDSLKTGSTYAQPATASTSYHSLI